MDLRKYLMIKTASMNKAADDAADRSYYKRGKKELENTIRGFERTLEDETTYPGYGYTQQMLGPYGVLEPPRGYIGTVSDMPHIPDVDMWYDGDDDTWHPYSNYNVPDKLKLGPTGTITEEPSKVFTDSPERQYAGWTSTDLGIKNPSFFGRLFGRKTINNPDVNRMAYDMRDTLTAMKYYYSKHPEEYKRAVKDYSHNLRYNELGSVFDKELEDFPF